MWVSEYLLRNILCTYVGPIRPTDFIRTRHRLRPEVGVVEVGGLVAMGGPPTREVDRVLR